MNWMINILFWIYWDELWIQSYMIIFHRDHFYVRKKKWCLKRHLFPVGSLKILYPGS